MKKVFGGLLVFVCVCLPVSGFAADGKNYASFIPGIGVSPDATAVLLMGEYERQLAPHLSINGRLASVSYDYDDGDYEEDGDGTGLEAGVRFYPKSQNMTGFYVGANIGLWSSDWDFTEDKGTAFQRSGSGDSDAINVNATAGFKFPLGQAVYLQPAAVLGNFFSVDDSCTYNDGTTCDNEAELGFYLVAACGVGFSF